jgi:hypothetical protein
LETRPVSPGTASPGAAASPAASASQTNISGPKIQFDATLYDFGKVMAGEQVNHTFYFTNAGCQDLILNNVHGTCGCTVVGDWTHQVKPGDSGQIPIAFNTAMYSYPVTKLITVSCNDKSQAMGMFSLQLKGVVWRPIEVIPQAASLLLKPDSPFGSVTVRLTNRLDQLLVLSTPQSSNPLFAAELRTNIFGRGYEVVISNTAALPPGSVQGHITLKTSVTNIPVIDITAWANSQPPLNVVPTRIDLRQAPLATNQLAYVTIINNSTNPITLSEPAVDAAGLDVKVTETQPGHPVQDQSAAGGTTPGQFSFSEAFGPQAQDQSGAGAKVVDVKITETQPGRYFTLLLKFPAGFELPAGHPGTFTIKTTHPRVPVVKVPIYQAARSTRAPLVFNRPAPPIAGSAAVVPQPPRPAPLPGPSLAFRAPATGTASSTNRPPPPPPPPNFP